MTINCALDGPSGAGKSTIAKAVAKKLGMFMLIPVRFIALSVFTAPEMG